MQKESTISQTQYFENQAAKSVNFRGIGCLPVYKTEKKTKTSEKCSENDGSLDLKQDVQHQQNSSTEEGLIMFQGTCPIQKDGQQMQNLNGILRQGYLKKQSTSLFSWDQPCYFLLTTEKLCCFQDQSRTNLISCLNLKLLSYNVEKQNLKLTITHHEKSQPIIVQADNMNQSEAWFRDIKRVIDFNASRKKIQIRQSKQHIYEEIDGIIESDFIDLAQTGDIILMRTENTQCALQRFITHSEYDHIGLVVRFADNQVKIFEANADDGVNLYDWDQFQSSFHCYQKMCFRKLHHTRKYQFQTILLNFIKKTIGREYDFNPLRLLRKDSDDQVEESKGYFCSELVAKAYKLMGLLDRQKPSSNYWPIDFTDRGGLLLKQGAYFGSQQLIILDKHLKCAP